VLKVATTFPVPIGVGRIDNASELIARVVSRWHSVYLNRLQKPGRVLDDPLAADAKMKKATQPFVLSARGILAVLKILTPVRAESSQD
jgi:hypothetical protein